MENLTMYVPIMAMSGLKYGVAIKTMRILQSIEGFNVNWNTACDALKDVTLFNTFTTKDIYSKRILQTALRRPDVRINTVYEKNESLDEASNMLKNFMLSDKEIYFLVKLYKRFIDEAVLNVLDNKVMFDISFSLPEEDTLKSFTGNAEVEKLNRIVQVLNSFWRYHQFFGVACALSIGLERGEKIINFSFMDEIVHMSEIQNNEWS